MTSLRVTTYTIPSGPQRTPVLIVNVFLEAPTTHAGAWRDFQVYCDRYAFTSLFYGTGRPNSQDKVCAAYCGADHPIELCPFPKIPGWRGSHAVTNTHQDPLPGAPRGRGGGRRGQPGRGCGGRRQ
ncbi:hypothetical protein EIP86_001637 [Pleurotus ostreatoroseus]|nr:hypothetical protein EIP86_001637 [Pleurotus ostreatoroseus]